MTPSGRVVRGRGSMVCVHVGALWHESGRFLTSLCCLLCFSATARHPKTTKATNTGVITTLLGDTTAMMTAGHETEIVGAMGTVTVIAIAIAIAHHHHRVAGGARPLDATKELIETKCLATCVLDFHARDAGMLSQSPSCHLSCLMYAFGLVQARAPSPRQNVAHAVRARSQMAKSELQLHPARLSDVVHLAPPLHPRVGPRVLPLLHVAPHALPLNHEGWPFFYSHENQ